MIISQLNEGENLSAPPAPREKWLNDYTWGEISQIAKEGNARNYFRVGDWKEVTLDGDIKTLHLDNVKLNAVIVGFDHNSKYEGNNTIHFCLGLEGNKYLVLVNEDNSSISNKEKYFYYTDDYMYNHGWVDSTVRKILLGQNPTDPEPSSYMSLLPLELRSVLASCNKYTYNKDDYPNREYNPNKYYPTEDYLWLFSGLELNEEFSYATTMDVKYQKTYKYFQDYDNSFRQMGVYKFNRRTQGSYTLCRDIAQGNYNAYLAWGGMNTFYQWDNSSTANQGLFIGFSIGESSPRNYTRFSDTTWKDIQETIKNGNAKNFFSIGDTRTVYLNGSYNGINYNNIPINTFIIGFDHKGNNSVQFMLGRSGTYGNYKDRALVQDYEKETGFIYGGNVGWDESGLKQNLSGIETLLPENLLEVMIPSPDGAKLDLPLSGEVFGSESSIISQFEYFKELPVDINANNTNLISYNYKDGFENEKVIWHLKDKFCIDTKGKIAVSNLNISYGIRPIFSIGEVTETIYKPLEDYTWKEISDIARAGLASDYFALGDSKSFKLQGSLETIKDIDVVTNATIIGFDHNRELEGNNTIHFQIGYVIATDKINAIGYPNWDSASPEERLSENFVMNSKYTNIGFAKENNPYNIEGAVPENSSIVTGGWRSSDMRNLTIGINPNGNNYLSLLPADLRKELLRVKKYFYNGISIDYTYDYLWLPAENERFPGRTNAAEIEKEYTETYEFYKESGNPPSIDILTGNSVPVWSRSISMNGENCFCTNVTVNGNQYAPSDQPLGFAPMFALGGRINKVLNDYTWKEISDICKAGQIENHFSVGDTKKITLNGPCKNEHYTNYEVNVFLVDIENDNNRMVFQCGIDDEGVGVAFGAPEGERIREDRWFGISGAAEFLYPSYINSNLYSTVFEEPGGPQNPQQSTKFLRLLPDDLRKVMVTSKRPFNVFKKPSSDSEFEETISSQYQVLFPPSIAEIMPGNEETLSFYQGHLKNKFYFRHSADSINKKPVAIWLRDIHLRDGEVFEGTLYDNSKESSIYFEKQYSSHCIAPLFVIA